MVSSTSFIYSFPSFSGPWELNLKTYNFVSDVVESIQNLIQRGEMIHAVKHICELKLTDKFSPATLLAEYLEDTQNTTTMICKGRRSNETKVMKSLNTLLSSQTYATSLYDT